MADISKIKLPDNSEYDIKDAKALPKTTYEYNKEISFGRSGKLLIGKFKCYDSNVTIEINSTTATTYHAVAVLATQNINSSHGGTITWNVYGDDSNTVASNLYLYYPSNSQWIEIYFSPSSWSNNLIHIQCVRIQAEATNVCERVSAIPETATVQPTNVSRNSYVFKNGDTMTGGLSIDGLTIKRAGIANGTVCNVGWFRIAKIKASSSTSGYPSFIMFYTGTYYNSKPSSCIISISGNYDTAYLNQINGYLNGTFTKIRLVSASSGKYYVDAYQSKNAPTSNLGPQHFTFIGAGNVETYSPTAPLETEETAIASLDIATNRIVSNIIGDVTGNATTAGNVTGTVSVAHGGTGKTTANDAANNLISGLPAWTANPTDDTYFVRQDTGGTSAFGRVKFSTLWNYIKGKFSGTSPITFSDGAIGINTASTSGYGATKLSTATNSTATDLAATPSAVKTAYDLANTANGTANSALSGVNGTLIYDHTYTISNGVATFTPHVYQKGVEVTTNYAKSCFTWKYRLIDGSEVALTTKNDRGCDVTITNLGYGGHVIGIFTPA